jgi:hypothetical protein
VLLPELKQGADDRLKMTDIHFFVKRLYGLIAQRVSKADEGGRIKWQFNSITVKVKTGPWQALGEAVQSKNAVRQN